MKNLVLLLVFLSPVVLFAKLDLKARAESAAPAASETTPVTTPESLSAQEAKSPDVSPVQPRLEPPASTPFSQRLKLNEPPAEATEAQKVVARAAEEQVRKETAASSFVPQVQGQPEFHFVAPAVLQGPSFVEGWAVVPLHGYAFKEATAVRLANGETYNFRVPGYLLVPSKEQGLVMINSQVLPTVNQLVKEQRKLISSIQEQLRETRPLPVLK